MRFDVYDRDADSERLSDHDFIGTVETTLGSILGRQVPRASAPVCFVPYCCHPPIVVADDADGSTVST